MQLKSLLQKMFQGALLITICSSIPVYAAPLLWNIPAKNPHFTSREALFNAVAQGFQEGTSLYVIAGSTGIGKSQFVKEFAHRFSEHYQVVWWFDANKTLPTQFVLFAQALNAILPLATQIPLQGASPEKIQEKVKDTLRRQSIKCLLIFDNIQDIENITGFIPFSHDNHISVLVTSRKKSTVYPSIGMQHFSAPDATTFVQKVLPHERPENQMKLVRTMYGHPLALAMALTAINAHPSVGIVSYLQAQKNQETAPLEKGLKVDQYAHTIQTALQTSLDMMAQKSPPAAKVMRLLTFVQPTQIPFSYLERWTQFAGSEETADQILKNICDQSLLEVHHTFDPHSKIQTKKNVKLTMHDLVHQVIHQQMSDAEKLSLLPAAIEMVSEAFEDRNDLMTQKILREPEHLLHAQRLLKIAKDLPYASVPLLSLQIRVLDCIACGQRDFETAKTLINDIHKTQEGLKKSIETLGIDGALSPLVSALDLRDEALLEIVLGFFEATYDSNYEKAIAHQEKALEIFEKIKGEEEQQLRALVNLLQYRILRGEMEEAQPLVEKGTRLLATSKSDLVNIFFVYGWALFLINQGEFKQAIQCIEKYEYLLPRVKDYPTHEMYVLYHKAKAFFKMGKQTACDEVLDSAEKLTHDFFGTRESTLKEAMTVLRILNSTHKNDEASRDVVRLQKIIQSYNKFWKGEKKHHNQAFAHFILGQVYERLGDKDKALEAYLMSEEIYNAILKEFRIDDVSQLYTALTKLGRQLNDEDVMSVYRMKHYKLFDPLHPRSQEIADYLIHYKNPK